MCPKPYPLTSKPCRIGKSQCSFLLLLRLNPYLFSEDAQATVREEGDRAVVSFGSTEEESTPLDNSGGKDSL